MAVGTGHGAYLTMNSIGGAHPVRSIQGHDASGAPINITDLQTGYTTPGGAKTSVSMQYIAHDLYEVGGMTLEYLLDSTDGGPALLVVDTIELTLPKRAGAAGNPGKWTGVGYVSQIDAGTMETNTEHTGTMTIQWLSLPTYTPETVA